MTSSTEQSLHVPFSSSFRDVPMVSIPFEVLDITANTLMRSRHSLTVLSQLLRRGSIDNIEEYMASLLDILIENMEVADQRVLPFLHPVA